MSKFRIKDEEGQEYEVEELIEETPAADEEAPVEELPEEKALLPEEIDALKRLAAIADQLIALIGNENEEELTDEKPEEMAEVEAKDEEPQEEEKEEVVDTKACDSKKSFGSLERTDVNDSNDEIARQLAIEEVWSKRYNK